MERVELATLPSELPFLRNPVSNSILMCHTFNSDKAGPYNCGINPNTLSGYHKFEGPDPAEWTNRGYAVINIDARGSFDSEGHMMRWGPKVCKSRQASCHVNHKLIN